MLYSDIDKLYKFKSINENLLNSLRTRRIYVPSIAELNDPFESNIYIKKIDGRKINKKYFKDLYISNIFNYVDSKSLSKQDVLYSNSKLKDFAKTYYFNEINHKYLSYDFNDESMIEFYQKIVSYMGVISFTTDNKSLLLWSHYGNSHTGVCLEFKRSEGSKLDDDNYSFPIRYSSFVEDIKVRSDSKEMIADFYKYKADVWSYEKEWRLITPNPKSMIDFPGELTSIYFGLNTSKENLKKIHEILGDSVEYFKAIKKTNMYDVEYMKMKLKDFI